MNVYWNIISGLLSAVSVFAAFNMDMNNPVALVAVLVVFGSTMFVFGHTAQAAKEKVNAKAESMLEQAARKAADAKMEEVEATVDERVEAVLEKSLLETADAVKEQREADEMLGELRGFKGQNSLKAYMAEEGRMESAAFRRSMSILVDRGDVSGVVEGDDGGFEVVGDVVVKQEDLSDLLKRVNIVHEFDMLDKE